MPSKQPFRNPSALTFATEPARATGEMLAFTALTPLLTRLPTGDGRPVLVLPGFTASDQSTASLRYVLARLDYSVHGWHLGQNLGPSQRIVDGMINRFEEIHQRYGGQPVTLVGWSLGGLYSRALAARFPDKVRHVITLGSPFRLTRAEETNVGRWFDRTAPVHGLRRPHSADFRREPYSGPPSVPSTAVFTKADGVVPWRSCVDVAGDRSENLEVFGSHCGLGYNPAVLGIVADRLRLADGEWRPFAPAPWHVGPYRTRPHIER
jgi:pimeloyl-ACP methyl ester carboxylesterase